MPLILTLVWTLLACTSAEVDCLTLQGGYEGADVEAIETECRADPDAYDCEADGYIEADAARCIFSGGTRDSGARLDVGLDYSPAYRTVVWWSAYTTGRVGYVRASDGEYLGAVSGDP